MILRSLLSASLLCVALAAPEAMARRLADANFHIKKGHHRSSNQGLGVHMLKWGKRHARKVTFKVLFPSSVPYTTPNASDQSDANKVMGLSMGKIHEDSVRLGWAWDPTTQKVQLRFYAYFNGRRDMTPLMQVPLNQWVAVEIKMSNEAMSVRAGDAYAERRVNLGWNAFTITGVLRTAYFGGESKAPHDIYVHVKDIDAE